MTVTDRSGALSVLLGEYEALRAELLAKLHERWLLTVAALAAIASIIPASLGDVTVDQRAVVLNLVASIVTLISFAQVVKMLQVYVIADYIRTHLRPSAEALVDWGSSAGSLGLLSWDDYLSQRSHGQNRLSSVINSIRRANETLPFAVAFVAPV
ncbi:MAG: hypothetical protein EPO65_04045, partial [Dehalococcoidia bacterium]